MSGCSEEPVIHKRVHTERGVLHMKRVSLSDARSINGGCRNAVMLWSRTRTWRLRPTPCTGTKYTWLCSCGKKFTTYVWN